MVVRKAAFYLKPWSPVDRRAVARQSREDVPVVTLAQTRSGVPVISVGEPRTLADLEVAAGAIEVTLDPATRSRVDEGRTFVMRCLAEAFGTQAALNAFDQARSLRLLHGSLAVALRQAVHVGARRPTAPVCADVMDQLIDQIPPIDPDRSLHQDVRRAADILDDITTSGTDQ